MHSCQECLEWNQAHDTSVSKATNITVRRDQKEACNLHKRLFDLNQ